jgi:hypothetical protein
MSQGKERAQGLIMLRQYEKRGGWSCPAIRVFASRHVPLVLELLVVVRFHGGHPNFCKIRHQRSGIFPDAAVR